MRYLLFIVILLSACVSERKRAKICATCPTSTTTIVRDSIVRKDSTIVLPGEILRDTIKVECDERNQPVISYKRPNRSGRASMNITRPDLNTIVSECVIDSQAVSISWNEKHRSVQSDSVIQVKQKGVIIWWYALIVSVLTFLIGLIYGMYKK